MGGQKATIVLSPFKQICLLVIVGDERNALARGDHSHRSIHDANSSYWKGCTTATAFGFARTVNAPSRPPVVSAANSLAATAPRDRRASPEMRPRRSDLRATTPNAFGAAPAKALHLATRR